MMKVIQTVQSSGPVDFGKLGDGPTDILFYTGDCHAKAIAAVATILASPDTEWYTTLNVRIEMEEV